MDLKNEVKYFSGLLADKAEQAFDSISNELEYRGNRIKEFWGIPDINISGLKKTADMILDPQQRPSINGEKPMLPSEMVEDAAAPMIAKAVNQISDATGLDARIGIPLLGLTVSNPKFLARGVKPGIASGPDFGPAMRKWNARRNELIEQRRNPQGLTAYRRQKNQKKSLVTAYNDVSTGPTTDPLDVEVYGKNKSKVKGKYQHHLFPKQESYQFVEHMKKIGDDDDVLNLFLYAEELDATMGGRLSNILNMDKNPHNTLHSNRINDGRQLKAMKMKNLVGSAKSTDELMELFDQYIRDNIQPSKAEARVLQKAFDDARSNLNRFKSLSEDARRRL